MSLDDKIKNILKKQKILPIINTINLYEDLKKIDNLISQKKYSMFRNNTIGEKKTTLVQILDWNDAYEKISRTKWNS